MVRNVDDDMDELFDFSHAGQRPLEQSHDAQERSLDLDAEMSLEADMMGQHWGAGTHVHDDAFDDNDHIHDYDHNHDRAYNEGTNNTGLGLGQSLADEFGLDLDDELGGENTGVGGTLAGELGGLDDLAGTSSPLISAPAAWQRDQGLDMLPYIIIRLSLT